MDNTTRLLLCKEAARLKRQRLREQGIDESYTNELGLQRLIVWVASCATIDVRDLPEEELPKVEGQLPTSPQFDEEYLQTLADKMVADATRCSLVEVAQMPPRDYARALGWAAVEVEAELLQIQRPEFAKSEEEKAAFRSAMNRGQLG